MARKTLIQARRDTAANWTATNPTLAAGEFGWESNTNKVKIGDGATAWNALGYFGGASISPLTTKGDVWGYSTTDARIPIGSNNFVLTADSTQALGLKWAAISSIVGGLVTLYDSGPIGGATATIDSGAGGFAGTSQHLLVVIYGRTTEVAITSAALMTFNNDAGANYDNQLLRANNATVTAAATAANNSMGLNIPGASDAASDFGNITAFIPSYASTNAHKVMVNIEGFASATIANSRAGVRADKWRSTAAINRIIITANAASNFAVGTQMTVFGLG